MSFSCPNCDFTANFESALTMHRQLHHHEDTAPPDPELRLPLKQDIPQKISPRDKSPSICTKRSLMNLGTRASATRILGKLRARICRSRTLFSHPEDPLDLMLNSDLSCRSDCTSKAMQLESTSRISAVTHVRDTTRETYACHLCDFEADRITVLDRHLLNDHKVGLDNLLKLVLAKTRDGLAEDNPPEPFGVRQPYYKPIPSVEDDILEDGEFMIETTTPKIRMLKHAATNTELTWTDIPELADNCRIISKELDRLIKSPSRPEKNDLMEKIQTLNDYMCKFVDSSNTLKRVLSRDTDGRSCARREPLADEPFFDLRLAEQDTPRSTRDWEKAYSDKLERYKSKHSDKFRSEKSKLSSESYYF